MRKSQNKPTNNQATQRYDAFAVQEYKSDGKDKTNWMRIGVAFPHGDGHGFNVELQAFPVGGKLVIRLHEERERTDDK